MVCRTENKFKTTYSSPLIFFPLEIHLFFVAKTHKDSQQTITIFVHQLSKKKTQATPYVSLYLSIFFFLFKGEDALWGKLDQENRATV